MEIINAPIYKCPKCGREDLYPTDFHRDNRRHNGLNGWCKACRAEARNRKNLKRQHSVLVPHYQTGRRNFCPNDRKRYDKLEREHVQCFFLIDGKIWRWGNWRKPAYESMEDFLQHQTELGRTVEAK